MMRLSPLIYTFLSLIIMHASLPGHPDSGVVMDRWEGRFGDQLFFYIRAKWIAHTLHVQFLYKPFHESHNLMLHIKETASGTTKRSQFIKQRTIRGKKTIHFPDSPNQEELKKIAHIESENTYGTLYRVGYCRNGYNYKADPSFIQHIREMIAPVEPIETTHPPSGYLSVALHVRTPSSPKHDIQNGRLWPTKFPPYEYYANALDTLLDCAPTDRPIYVHLFTDHTNPKEVAYRIQTLMTHNAQKMSWGWREDGNRFNKNILIDFFSLLNFECLIRPWSNFSRVPEILGDHIFVVEPAIKSVDGKNKIKRKVIRNIWHNREGIW